MDSEYIKQLRAKGLEIKKDIIEVAVHAGEGHCASALSIADIMTALYFHKLRLNPENPAWPDRDRFVLSKGHACQALYVALHHAGFFDREKLFTFLQNDSGLGGHPVRGGAAGVEVSTGSLGHGFSVCVGMALAAKVDKKDYGVFALIGDGESNEGIIWEAALAASHYKLDTLTAVLDRNRYQCDGPSDSVMNIDPVADKWKGFGWEVRDCDGHNMAELVDLLDQLPFVKDKPSLILARTVKGNGVPFMENSATWHYKSPSKEQRDEAIKYLQESCYQ